MATKTISVDLEAYERLHRARLSPNESFSQVIRRAKWDSTSKTCGRLLAELSRGDLYLGEEQVRRLEEAQAADTPPESPWR